MVRTSRENKKCYVCGKDHTRYYWHNVYDKNGNWTGRCICYDCNLDKNKKNNKNIKELRIKNRKCCKCQNSEMTIKHDGGPDWRRYRGNDNSEIWDGKSFLCLKCYMKIINDLPDSHKNLIKKMRLSRVGNLDKLSNHGKDIIGQWIGGKTLGVRDLNVDKNNFRESVDLSRHQIYNNVDVKISTFNEVNEQWRFDGIRYAYDNLLLLCADKYEPWKNIERVYIIPISHINTSSITIVRYLSKGGKYEIHKIDEKPFNETYHSVDIPDLFNPFDLWKGRYDVKKKDYSDIVGL